MAIHLGARARKAIRYAGIAVFAFITFVFAVQMSFPYDRVKDKLVDALSSGYDVTIGGVERGWVPGRVYFKALTLRTRQAKPEDPMTTFYIEKLEVDLGLFALLAGKASINLDAKIASGHVKGNVTVGKSGLSIDLVGHDLPGADLPMHAVLGLPMSGKIEFAVALDLPNEKNKMGRLTQNWSKAEGKIELSCPTGCTFGDGKTRLKPLLKNRSNQLMVGDGIDFGKVNLDSLVAKVEITPGTGDKQGKLEVTKFETKSADGELHVEYMMALQPELAESLVTGCLRFKGSEILAKREPKTFAALTTTGAELRGDGLFHIKLSDRFKDMKRLNLECGPNIKGNNGEDFSGGPHIPARPNLTVMPDEPTKPAGSPTPTPPPPPIGTPPIEPAPGTRGGPGSMQGRPAPEGEAGSGSAGSGSATPAEANPGAPPAGSGAGGPPAARN